MKIAVIGLGYVGLPLSTLLSDKFDVVGFDNDAGKVEKIKLGMDVVSEPELPQLLSNALKGGKLSLTSEISETKSSDVKIITVGTPFDLLSETIDFSQLDSAINVLKSVLKAGDVVILKSTVPPGTTMHRVKTMVEGFGYKVPEDIGLVFSPERMIEGQAIRDFRSLPKIIGASDQRSNSVAQTILSALGGKLVPVSSPTTAEMVKMVDNYSRFVFLGLTNEIALMSEKVGVDVMELINAAKEDYPRNSGLLRPGPGVGGSCLNKDPFIIQSHMRNTGLQLQMVNAAKSVNYSMARHVVDLVCEFSGNRKKVVILGVAFKGDTNDTRFTTSYEIAENLKNEGFEVKLSDPLVNDHSLEIAHDLYESLEGSEILLLMTDHSEYRKVGLEKVRSLMTGIPLIIDTRAIIDRIEAVKMGFEYHGLGRI